MGRGLRPLFGFVRELLGDLLPVVRLGFRKAVGPAPARPAVRAGIGGKAGQEFGHRGGNRVPRSSCSVTGHPVDVATGKVFTSFTDVELPGPLPFSLERVWFSTSAYAGPLGHGWHHCFDAGLYVTPEAMVYRTPNGRFVDLAPVRVGERCFDRWERLTIVGEESGYLIVGADGVSRRFTPGAVQEGEPEPVRYLLREVESRAGHRICLSHDEADRLVEIVDSGGRSIRFAHDEAGRIVRVTAPALDQAGDRLTVAAYAYDEVGNLISATDARGYSFGYEYAGHLLVKETDRNGSAFVFEYDGEGVDARCVRTRGDGGLLRRELSYGSSMTMVTNSLGHTSTYHHQAGLVTRTVDELGAMTRTAYAYGQPVEETDPLGRVTGYGYDHRGNLVTVTMPDGSRVESRFDERDLPVAATDQVGARWEWEYDEAGLLVQRRDPLGRVTRFGYQAGLLALVVDPAGGETKIEYDVQGSPVRVTTPDGERTRWRRNELGWPVAEVNPLGAQTRRTFDAAGNVIRLEEADGNVRELAYDGEENVISAVDALYDVSFGYTGMDRLAWRSQAGTTVYFRYDTEDQLVGVENEHGFVYSFDYGPTGLVSIERGFDGIARVYERDIAGRVVSVRRPSGEMSRHEYDALDRLTAVQHADGTSQRYAYRADGALMLAGNDTIDVRFERDSLGRLLRETQGEFWVVSEYDDLDNRVRLTSSMGADQRFTRNAMGDVMSMAGNGVEINFTRDGLGQELVRDLPGGARSRWERDNIGRPVRQQITGAGGSELRDRRYEWAVGGRLRGILDSLTGPIQYAHDGLGQLVSATYGDGTVELRMPDAVGNLFRTEDRSDRVYGAAGQVLEAIDEHGRRVKYDYDAEGNMVAKTASDGERWEYRWGADGYMSSVLRPDGSEVTFAYDALGRRVSKSFRGQTTRWVWDGDVPLHEWVEGAPLPAPNNSLPDANDAIAAQREAALSAFVRRGPPERGSRSEPITWHFEPETFALAARSVAGQAQAALTDQLGVTITIVDSFGESIWHGSPSIWGNHSLGGDDSPWPFRWPGQYFDLETGLHYNRHRYYDPVVGVFCSVDPLALLGGMGPYCHVGDVLSVVDPLGLMDQADYARSTARIESQVLFGQARIGPTFSTKDGVPAYLKGRLISDVSSDLRAGRMSPNAIRIEVFEHGGNLVAVNNRGLAALSDAGLNPTNVHMRDVKALPRSVQERLKEVSALDEHLPSPRIAVTPTQSDWTILRVVSVRHKAG